MVHCLNQISCQCHSKVELIRLGSAHEKYSVWTRPDPILNASKWGCFFDWCFNRTNMKDCACNEILQKARAALWSLLRGGRYVPSLNFIMRSRPCPCWYLTDLFVICCHFIGLMLLFQCHAAGRNFTPAGPLLCGNPGLPPDLSFYIPNILGFFCV